MKNINSHLTNNNPILPPTFYKFNEEVNLFNTIKIITLLFLQIINKIFLFI